MEYYHLNNEFLSVTISSKGAELISLKDDKSVELLWQADEAIWPRHAPVLFPIVGRLKNNTYKFNGKEYSLTQHGFARDKEFTLINRADDFLTFELVSNNQTLEVFPFDFKLQIKYTLLKTKLVTTYTVINASQEKMFFGIGAHPGFNTKTCANETLGNYTIIFDGINELVAEALKDGLLSGETYTIPLNNGTLKLASALFENDALVFKNNQIKSLTLTSKLSNRKIKMICTDWPFYGIWTKKGCDQFICLEPWYGITDSVLSTGDLEEKLGINCLEAMQSRQFEFIIEVS